MPRTILVVDDVEMNRRILRRILEPEYNVVEAEDGREALTILYRRYRIISAILLDLVMPKMDGYELLDSMRSNPMFTQIPVIVNTASAESETEIAALHMGATDYISMPFNPEIIKGRLKNLIRLRESSSIINALQTDKLTGLNNREAFFAKAQEMINFAPPGHYALSAIDIDKFSVINDLYGIAKGDEYLKAVAGVLKSTFGAMGGLCCRMNADNFAILYPARAMDSVEISQEHLIAANRDEGTPPMVFSIGRYIIEDTSLPISTMYDRAYMAKASVKGNYDRHLATYSEEMRENVLHNQRIVDEMNPALAGGEFVAYFQPQYNMSNGLLIGAEALARWNHPVRGMVSPGEFIPVFERNGFIYELDKYIWDKACACVRACLDEHGQALPISVNISRYDIFRDDLMDVLTGLLHKYRLTPDKLRLEITESAFTNDSQRIIQVVNQLVDAGFTVEIDDFGSGYSSLNTLKDVPAQIIKLDLRFLEGRDNLERGGGIIESVVRMARWLNMTVIAEGVETAEQGQYLKSIGCVYAQGYFYGRPMPESSYIEVLKNAELEKTLMALKTIEHLDGNAFWNPKSIDALIFNSYVGAACIYDVTGDAIRLIRATDSYASALKRLGLDINVAMTYNWRNYFDEKSISDTYAAIGKSLEKRLNVPVELTLSGLPGLEGTFYFRTTIRVIATWGDSQIVYCLNKNTTAQHIAEEEKRLATAQLRAIMAGINGGVSAAVMENGKVRYLFANDQFYSMLGYTREEFEKELPGGLYDLVLPEDKAGALDQYARHMENGSTSSSEFRVTRKDGRVIWLHASGSVCDFEGISHKVNLAIYTDITADRIKNQKLSDAEQIQAIMRNMTGGVAALTIINKTAKYIFLNDQFSAIFGYAPGEFLYERPGGILDMVLPDDAGMLFDGIKRLEETGEQTRLEFRCARRDGRVIWVRCQSSICRMAEVDAPVHLVVVNDITKEIEAQRQLLEADDQLRFLNDTAHELLAQPDTDKSVSRVLNRIMNYFGGNRAYIFERDPETLESSNTYEVCAEGVSSEKDNLQNLPFDLMAFWWNTFDRDQYISIQDVSALGGDRTDEKRVLSNQGFKSLVAVPFRRDGNITGFVGVDDPTRQLSHTGRLIALGDYLCAMIMRRDFTLRIERDAAEAEAAKRTRELSENLQTMMDDMPGGFLRLKLDGERLTVDYINENLLRLTGRAREDMISGTDVTEMSRTHPDDRERLKGFIAGVLKSGESGLLPCRIMTAGGSYAPVNIFARVSGEKYLNVYFADMTESERRAFTSRETLPYVLSALMESSADLDYAKDAELNYICASPAFARLAGAESPDMVIGKNEYDFFPKDVADGFRAIDLKVLAEGRAVSNYAEKIPSDDGMPHYAETSKYVLRDTLGSVIGLYCHARDVTSDKSALERLTLLTDSIPGGIAAYSVSPRGIKLRYINDGYCRTLGYTKEEFIATAKAGHRIIFEEDRPMVDGQFKAAVREGAPVNCVYRVRVGEGYKWVHHIGRVTERYGDECLINTMLTDVTERQEMIERLRASEEQFRLAADMSGVMLGKYDLRSSAYSHSDKALMALGFPSTILNAPQAFIDADCVAPESVGAMTDFFAGLRRGEPQPPTDMRLRMANGEFHWCQKSATFIFDREGRPTQAIIITMDISDRREKDLVYKKWLQSLQEKALESYTLYRCNLSQNATFDTAKGSLLKIRFDSRKNASFDDYTREYAEKYVHPEDRAEYEALLNSDAMLAGYRHGKRAREMDFREITEDGGTRWLKVNVELVEYPDSKEIEAYLMYENIDREKREALLVKERAEQDPLTGVLNRATFSARVNEMISKMPSGTQSALFMLDLDGFKLLNDNFGHAAGDQTLIDMAQGARSILRSCDLIGRLGDDEFMIYLSEMPGDEEIENKAWQISRLMRKAYSAEVRVSASVGMAVCPRDGNDFESLYRRADAALYSVKESGKDDYRFYHAGMAESGAPITALDEISSHRAPRRRLLIVEDSEIDTEILAAMFEDDYEIVTASDGYSALQRLRHYGTAISAVLLDLVMPIMDGFKVLERMRSHLDMRSIPVVVVSVSDDRETALRAIRCGASDFVAKPVDADIIKLRVKSAIARSENGRLRAQNGFMTMQNDEISKYRAVLEGSGIAIIEYDHISGEFEYEGSVTALTGRSFESRNFWEVLKTEAGADPAEIEKVREMTGDIARDKARTRGEARITLTIPSGERREFLIRVIKLESAFALTGKMIITLKIAEK